MFLIILAIFTSLFPQQKEQLKYEIRLGDKYCLKVVQNGPQVCGLPSEQPKLTKLGFLDSVKDLVVDRNFCPIKRTNLVSYNKNLIKDNIKEQVNSKKLSTSDLVFYVITQKNLYVEYNDDCSFSVVFQDVTQAEYPGYCYQDIRGGPQIIDGKLRAGIVTDGYYIISKIYQFYVTKSDGSELEYYYKESKDWFNIN